MSKPLTNEDFRKLLSTPVVRSGQTSQNKAAEGEGEKAAKKRKFYTPKPVKGDGKPAKEEQKYRDRAAERREGKDEYAGQEEYDVKPEETVFLGGDMEHTHLVKVRGGTLGAWLIFLFWLCVHLCPVL